MPDIERVRKCKVIRSENELGRPCNKIVARIGYHKRCCGWGIHNQRVYLDLKPHADRRASITGYQLLLILLGHLHPDADDTIKTDLSVKEACVLLQGRVNWRCCSVAHLNRISSDSACRGVLQIEPVVAVDV